ncbi:multidrug resistance protein [Catellatospora sp. IY07-71]|nr:multidrug resistance protein [Catellatospora sp. IY07-71]
MIQMGGNRKVFYHLLANTLLVSVINFTVWFAITFYVYLQTRSVFATSIIAGIFLVMTALTGIWFGSLVDHHRKKTVMQASALISLTLYAAAFVIDQLTPEREFTDPSSVLLWTFVVLLMLGVIAGNIRTIALPTLVTVLIPEAERDKANGLVGSATGVSFLVTSVISGVLVGASGMFWVLLLAVGVLGAAMLHLGLLPVPERPAAAQPEPGEQAAAPDRTIDLRGTLRVVGNVPGLPALILFSAFNNFLGGVYMALLDAYGLSLVSVQAWGLLWGVLSTGFIFGGLLVARTGLGRNPLRLLLGVNAVLWSVTILFPLRSSVVLLAAGMYAYMLLVPYAEAAEQTILQKVVPYERQGRVFGFAQSVEQAASPLTAFLIGPIAQFVFIPLMTDGAGADAIGGWFGVGPDRGLALVFVLTGMIGLAVTVLALRSTPYRRLSGYYLAQPESPPPAAEPDADADAVDLDEEPDRGSTHRRASSP